LCQQGDRSARRRPQTPIASRSSSITIHRSSLPVGSMSLRCCLMRCCKVTNSSSSLKAPTVALFRRGGCAASKRSSREPASVG
jgi:hypothetical protein